MKRTTLRAAACFIFARTQAFQASRKIGNQRVALALASQKYEAYDISKPVLDLFAFRRVRGDALAKYNSLNQSEPLRINLFVLSMLTLFSSPVLVPELSGEPMSFQQTAVAGLAGVACGGLLLRECRRRSRQLTRLEKELQALDLTLRLPTNAIAGQPFAEASTVLKLLRSKSIRLIVVTGSTDELKPCFQDLKMLGNRFCQSNTFVVPVSRTESSQPVDWGLDPDLRYPWLAEPGSLKAWQNYFDELSSFEGQKPSFQWFGLTASGRSFGSGNSAPSWLQVLGKSLRPVSVLSETDKAATVAAEASPILTKQKEFYRALTEGDKDSMAKLWIESEAQDVSAVLQQGGRLDAWSDCLEDGARPAGMKVSGADVTVASDLLAYSTVVEFPAVDAVDATLLAVQTWERRTTFDDWKLLKHQTIPWSTMPAGGTLLCDKRGCVSLVRAS